MPVSGSVSPDLLNKLSLGIFITKALTTSLKPIDEVRMGILLSHFLY